MIRPMFTTVALLLLSGCATQATLTVYSQPPGAYITEEGTGRVLGLAPAISYYNEAALKSNGTDAAGCYRVDGFEARWVSGAAASTNVLTLCSGATNDYHITLTRDSSYPGLEKDLEFAMQLQALQLQQQQAQAAQDAAAAALMGAFSRAAQSYKQQPSVHCYTQATDNTSQTVCH